MPEWISVEERLPEDSHSVLAYCPEIKCIFTAYYDDFAGEWVHFGGCMPGEVYYPVSHWMPLPEPPKEEGMEENKRYFTRLNWLDWLKQEAARNERKSSDKVPMV